MEYFDKKLSHVVKLSSEEFGVLQEAYGHRFSDCTCLGWVSVLLIKELYKMSSDSVQRVADELVEKGLIETDSAISLCELTDLVGAVEQ